MAEDSRSPIIKPAVDASGVAPGFEQVKKAARDASVAVGAEGRKAGEGLSGIGDGAKKGADKTDRETGRMIAAIQRVQAATERRVNFNNTAGYFESLAKQRGVNIESLRPYLDGLKAAETAQKSATAGLNTMGRSAKATSDALRGVPAQFTDIALSLARGQKPLEVLLRQGGQLQGMFGGAGKELRSMGGSVVGLINPVTVLAAGVAAVAAGFVLGSKESQAYTAALVLSGNAAGTTTNQLVLMARAIDTASGATQSKAAAVLTQLAATGEVGAQSLQRFAQAAIELERAGGPAAEETAKAFAELGKSPLQAALRLTETTRFLTAATAEQIQTLEQQGRTVEAARVAQEAYSQAIEQRAPELAARLGLVERAWLGIKDATKAAGDAVLDIGRPNTLQQQIALVDEAISRAQRLQGQDGGGLLGKLLGGDVSALRAQREALQEQERLQNRAAQAQGERVRQNEAGVAWLKEGQKYLSDQAKFEQEVVRIRAQGLAAGKSELEIAQRLRDLVAQRYGNKAANTESAAERERERALQAQARLLAELSGLTSSYAQDLATLDAARRSGTISEERYGELVRELVARQPIVRANTQAMARAAEEEARAVARAQKTYEDYIGSLQRSVDARDKTLQQLRLEYIELTAGKSVRQELELLELQRLATTYQQAAATAALESEEQARYQRLAEQVREEIRIRRGILAGTAQNEARQANERAAADAASDWERTADQIGQSLADAIFDGGKSAADLLRSYFRTLVLKPVIEAAVRPLALAFSSALGFGGPAAAAGGGGGGAGGFNLTSLLGLGGSSAIFNAGVQAAMSGNLGGSLSAAGNLIAGGNVGTGLSFGAGALAPYAGGFAAGIYGGRAISGGYAISGSGNGVVNAGAVAGAIIGGPIGAAIGGAIGGAANRLFGRKLTDTGFEGSFGAGGDFSGNQFQFLKGGFLRSSKTERSALDSDLKSVLDAGGQAAYAQALAYADALGLPVDALNGYTQAIKISLRDLSEQQAQETITKAVTDFQEGLLGRFSAQLEPLRRTGETLSQVAARVAELQIFTRGLSDLGGVFGRVAGLSIDAREQLIAFAGGMEALRSQALSFVQQYYSREEIAGIKAREVQAVLAAAGITQDISTRDQFRGVVDGTDVSTEAGRQRLAQLLAIGGDFAQVADYLAEVGGSLASAASQAPATGALAELFSQPAQAQVDAINSVKAGVHMTNALLEQVIEAVRKVWVREPTWEVNQP